jgi:hypothetical protein
MEELLHKAIENGDEARVRELIQLGAAMDKLMGFRGTALCAAISDHQTSIAFYLIDAGCDVTPFSIALCSNSSINLRNKDIQMLFLKYRPSMTY